MTLFQLSYILVWVMALLLIPISVVLLYLSAQLQQQIARESSGIGNNLIGRRFPVSSAKDPSSGKECAFPAFSDQIHVVLALSPGCNTCRALVNELKIKGSGEFAEIKSLILCMGDFERCEEAMAGIHSVPTFYEDRRDDSTNDLWYAGFPAAIVVDEDGMVVDVRHPLTVKGVVAAARNSIVRDIYRVRERRIASA